MDKWVAAHVAPDVGKEASLNVALAGRIGVRVNPQVGAGTNAQLSTGTATSKFGIGMDDDRQRLIQAYVDRPWLTMMHCHVGSQGVPIELAVSGIEMIAALAHEINQIIGHTQIDTVDIGGGLGVNFGSDEITPTFAEYAAALKKGAPSVQHFPIKVTEFGRAVAAKAGYLASRIEYSKESGGRAIVTQHAGVDLCIRTVYHPDKWFAPPSLSEAQIQCEWSLSFRSTNTM